MSRVDRVFRDYNGRRIAFIKAFTSEFDDFYHQCDPEKEDLMLYGHPNNKWELRYPAYENMIPELPEPILGINVAVEGVQTEHWLCLVAAYSDSWLLAVASFFAARFRLDRADRERLFDKINNLPTLLDIVITEFKDKPAESTSTSSPNNKKSNSTSKQQKKGNVKCQDTRSSSLKQVLQDKAASHLKGLKSDSESQKQDLPLDIIIPAPKSVAVSNSDEEKSRIEDVGTTGKKEKMMKSKISETSQSESSALVVRVVDNCTDFASDPTMKLAGPKTFRQARPSAR